MQRPLDSIVPDPKKRGASKGQGNSKVKPVGCFGYEIGDNEPDNDFTDDENYFEAPNYLR
jgi:hypothetical protein